MECQTVHRPNVDSTDIKSFVKTNLNCEVTNIEELRSYEDRNFHIKMEHINKDENSFQQIPRDLKNLIIKIVKYSGESVLKWKFIKEIMRHLQQDGFTCTQIVPFDENMSTIVKNGEFY